MAKQKFVTHKHIKDQQKKIKRESGRWWHEIELKCSICKRIFILTTTNVELYTDEIKKHITCVICDNKKERQND
jgi:hypothetical protein